MLKIGNLNSLMHQIIPINMRGTPYTEHEIDFIKAYYASTKTSKIAADLNRKVGAIYSMADRLGLKKSAEFLKSPESGRSNLITGGKATRFTKGQTPFNKGKKLAEFLSPEAIARVKSTQFKKGNLPHNTRADGMVSRRKDKSGRSYWYTRVAQGKWRMIHVLNWEAVNGKVPAGSVLVFKDGNTDNYQVQNLALKTRKEHMLNNSIINYPADVRGVIKTLSKLKKAIAENE